MMISGMVIMFCCLCICIMVYVNVFTTDEKIKKYKSFITLACIILYMLAVVIYIYNLHLSNEKLEKSQDEYEVDITETMEQLEEIDETLDEWNERLEKIDNDLDDIQLKLEILEQQVNLHKGEL